MMIKQKECGRSGGGPIEEFTRNGGEGIKSPTHGNWCPNQDMNQSPNTIQV
jgi:hypothetical protein